MLQTFLLCCTTGAVVLFRCRLPSASSICPLMYLPSFNTGMDLETVEVCMTFTLISRSRVCVCGGGGTAILVHSIEWGQDFAFHPQNEDILRCEDLYVRTIKVRESSWGMFHVCESPYKDGTTNLCVGGGGTI